MKLSHASLFSIVDPLSFHFLDKMYKITIKADKYTMGTIAMTTIYSSWEYFFRRAFFRTGAT